jgi:hypothetical protein
VNDRHSDDAMIDAALTREIEDAFAVEPSPHFVARVLANKPERRTSRFSWTFIVSASAAAAAIVAAGLLLPGRGARTPAPEAKLIIATLPPVSGTASSVSAAAPETPRVASAPATARAAPIVAVVPVVRRAETNEPEVLFAKDESAALQRLMRGITRGAVDPATLSEPTTAIAAIQPGQIVLAPLADVSPITIEPFGSLVEGVRQ